MIVAQLIAHGLFGVALLGAITHQLVALLCQRPGRAGGFFARYAAVQPERFTRAVVVLFLLAAAMGASVYPSYRLDVRIPFEEMGLAWAVGIFELKEHLAGIGLGCLAVYAALWRPEFATTHARDRLFGTALLACIIWFDFIVGHILNNLRGLT